jgi:hypothetical protein
MIRDLEELLLRINDAPSREYMGEAVRCYHAGCYRAAVVLAVAAGADGLLTRLQEVTVSGGGATLRKAVNQVAKLKKNQKPYELAAVFAARDHMSFLSPADACKLELLLKTRHMSAHPSGYPGRPEEARDAIASIVDIVLSRPAALGAAGVAPLLARILSPAFFPINAALSAAEIVAHETRSLTPQAFPVLAKELNKAIDSAMAHSPEMHALTRFVAGLCAAAKGDPKKPTGLQVLETLVTNSKADAVTAVLALEPGSIDGLGVLTRDRAVNFVAENLVDGNARKAAAAWLQESSSSLRQPQRTSLVSLGAALPAAMAFELQSPEVDRAVFERLVRDAGSSTFHVSNSAVDEIQALAPEVAARCPEPLRSSYVVSVIESAGDGPNGGRSAQGALKAGLAARIDFLDHFLKSASIDKLEVAVTQTQMGGLARLCVAAKREEALAAAMPALFKRFAGDGGVFWAASRVRSAGNELLKQKANELQVLYPSASTPP